WAAIGARGVLNTTLMDAQNVTEMILSDNQHTDHEDFILPPLTPHPRVLPMNLLPRFEYLLEEVPPTINEAVRDGRVITYEDWKVVDEYEIEQGKVLGKDRKKLIWSEVLQAGLI